jgi:hypothetical protein
MLMKIALGAFVALVFIGLGVSGTINAALAGYHTVEQNPTVQQLQNKTETTLKAEVHTQLANVENAAAAAISQKIGSATT